VVVELREDGREQGQATFAITAGGQPAKAEVRLGYADGERRVQAATGEVPSFSALRYIHFHLPATQAQEVKTWAHRVTPEGDSEGLPARLKVCRDGDAAEFDLGLSGGQVVLPLAGEACRLEITFTEAKRVGETDN